MKRIFSSTIFAGVLILSGAVTASAAHVGGHGFASPGASHMRAPASTAAHASPRASVASPAYLPSHRIGPAYRIGGPGFGWYGYDPLWFGAGDPDFYYPYVVPAGEVTGGLRLEVQPKDAQVFVDGYYAGIVDDFDGHFQHVDLTPGGHRVEVRAQGFQTLGFNTYIQPDHTTDFKAAMSPVGAPR